MSQRRRPLAARARATARRARTVRERVTCSGSPFRALAPIMPSAFAAEDLLAHIVDLACTRGARALAALGARTAVAARTDDACRGCERIADPGDVEDVGDRPERLARHLGYARLAAAMQALGEEGVDQGLAGPPVGGGRGRQAPTQGEHMRVARHVVHADRVTAVKERPLAVAQH